MGKLLRGLAILAAGTGAMFAAKPVYSADFGEAKVPIPAAIPIQTSALWSGLYLGGHQGGVVDRQGRTTNRDEDFIAGAHLGYNWQDSQVVYGIEGDLSYDNDTFGSIRSRLGFAGGRSWLLYGTAGIAISDNDEGLVAGGGIEYKVASNTSIGAEALYYDLDEDFTVIRGRVTWHFGGTR